MARNALLVLFLVVAGLAAWLVLTSGPRPGSPRPRAPAERPDAPEPASPASPTRDQDLRTIPGLPERGTETPAGPDATESRLVELIARDGEGALVSGAIATVDQFQTETAGPDGRIRLRLGLDPTVVHLAAIGYFSKQVEIPEEATSPVEARLERAAMLTVRPREPDGTPAEGVTVVYECDGPLLDPTGSANLPGYDPRDGKLRDGETILVPARPDVLYVVEVRDDLTGRSLSRDEIRLEPGEWREFWPTVSEAGRVVSGRVTDETGGDIEKAVIRVSAPGGGHVETSTGRDGRFRVGGIRLDRIRVSARKPEYAPFEEEFDVPVAGRSVVIRLLRSRGVVLTAEDTAGRRVTPDAGGALGEGLSIFGVLQSGGRVWFGNLPVGRVVLWVEYAGRRFETKHDTALPEARIVVPETGSVQVTIPQTPGEIGSRRLRLRPAGGGAGEQVRRIPPHGRTPLEFGRVLPGTYRAEIEDAETKRSLAESETFVVEPGRETRVAFTR